jgi:orotate phosphoribosyltransferase
MSTRTAKAVGTPGAASGFSNHRENRSMLRVASPKQAAILSKERGRLLQIIRKKSLLKGKFKLASGATSDYYLDMKPTTFDPEGANLIADIVHSMLSSDHDVEAIGGLEVGSVPIVIGVSMRSWPKRPITGFVVRKEKKGHGTDKLIDANFRPNSTVALFEDVTTTGDSVMQAVRAVRQQGATVKKIITIVDRLEGAVNNLKREGIELEAVFKAPELLSEE